MNEEILYYIWKFQKFNARDLTTVDGNGVTVIYPGHRNLHSGPDFIEGKIKIDEIDWYGNIEIHVKASDWYKHGHQNDKAYKNVILHVVWENDKTVVLDQNPIPCIELKGKIIPSFISRVETLLSNIQMVPCSQLNRQWLGIETHSMIETAAIQRLERKSELVIRELAQLAGDWEEAFYRRLAHNFGFKVNQELFHKLATLIPHQIVAKNSKRLDLLESIFFGVAGFLSAKPKDPYHESLLSEFKYLKLKYRLQSLKNPDWKFLRMRPANFPSIRIAQFSALYHKRPFLFRSVLEAGSLADLERIFMTQTSHYWEEHFLFGKTVKKKSSSIGSSSINLILINTVIPFLFSYGKLYDQGVYVDKALNVLSLIKPEKNVITANWENMGMKISSAFDSQGSIELFQNFCQAKKCLQCKIGIKLLNEQYEGEVRI